MLDNHSAKKAEKAYQRALTVWQAQRDEQAELLHIAQSTTGTGAEGILLRSGEGVFLQVTNTSLVEERRGPGHYAGRSSGV